ncbi:hypothetical protein J2Y67_002055 [Neobacillus niacini]|nr:hypothetical protein [Neobacillus niacini]MDR6999605.1 hypothetical protein [Neobacillus niacini]
MNFFTLNLWQQVSKRIVPRIFCFASSTGSFMDLATSTWAAR